MEQQDRPADQNEGNTEPTEVDAINNIDTARMSLRWALERISSTEKLRVEASDKAAREERAKTAVERECQALRRAMAANAEEASHREVYYKKLEGLMDLKLAGKLDLQALVKHESEVARMHEYLLARQKDLETDYAVRRDDLEKQYQTFRAEAEKERREAALKSEESISMRRQTLDKEFAPKLVEVHEVEAHLRAQEKILADRQAHFEAFYTEQRGALDRELANRQAFRDQAWEKQKAALIQELSEWRVKYQEAADKNADLQNEVITARERNKQTDVSMANEAMMREEASRLRRRNQEEAEKNLSLEKRLSEAAEAQKRAESAAAREALERNRSESSMQAEINELTIRCHGQNDRAVSLEKRLVEAEERAKLVEMHASNEAALSREAADLRKRLENASDRAIDLERQLSERHDRACRAESESARHAHEAAQIEGLRKDETETFTKKAQEHMARIVDLEKRLAIAEEKASSSQMVMEVKVEEAARHALETDQLEALRKDETETFTKKAQEHMARIVDLEKRLALAEEKAERSQMAMELKTEEARRIDALERAEAAEFQEKTQALTDRVLSLETSYEEAQARANEAERLLASRTGALQRAEDSFKRESTVYAQKAQEAAQRTVEMQNLLSGTEEKVKRADLAAAHEHTLLQEIALLREKYREHMDKNVELEQLLAASDEAAKRAQATADTETEAHARSEESRQSDASVWSEKSRSQIARIVELEKKLSQAEDKAGRSQMMMELKTEEVERIESLEREETASLLQKCQESGSKIAELEKALLEAKQDSAHEADLQRELAFLRAKFQAQLDKNIDLERRGTEALELAKRADLADANENALRDETARLRATHAGDLDRILSLERETGAAQNAAARAQASAVRQQDEMASLIQHHKELLEKTAGLEKNLLTCQEHTRLSDIKAAYEAALSQEVAALRRDLADAAGRNLELERRLCLAEEKAKQSDTTTQRDARLAEEAAVWRQRSADQEKAVFEAQKEVAALRDRVKETEAAAEWKQRAEERGKTVAELERKLVALSNELQRKYQDALAKGLELETSLVETQDKARRASLSAGSEETLRSEAEAFQRKCQEQTTRILDLERSLADAQERAKRAELSGASEALEKRLFLAEEAARQAEKIAHDRGTVLSERQGQWESERQGLLESLRRLEESRQEHGRELRDRIDSESARGRDLEKKLALAQEAARRAHADAETSRLLLDERVRQWEAEKAALYAECSNLDVPSRERLQTVIEKVEERWARERLSLTEEVNGWKRRHNELLTQVMEFESRLVEAESASQNAAKHSGREAEERKRIEHQARSEADAWKARQAESRDKIAELERRISMAQDDVQAARAEANLAKSILAEREKKRE
ncbi:MAG: hypothetical protein HZB91_04740 [Elusimicrobia bacterium]|nr:hypothetical protein [Elusimicrobiota bacterium]